MVLFTVVIVSYDVNIEDTSSNNIVETPQINHTHR